MRCRGVAAFVLIVCPLSCLQLQDPSADVTDIARQLADVTAVMTHAQTPLQTGDLKVAVDIIEKISQRGFNNVQNYPPPLRGEKVRKIAQVCAFNFAFHHELADFFSFLF